MITCCNKCGINWATLWSEDNENGTHEFCPVCLTDMYFGPPTDIITYCKCPITGNIFNSYTGEFYALPTPPPPVIKPRYIRTSKTRLSYEERDLLELKALESYHNSGGKQDYFKTFINQ